MRARAPRCGAILSLAALLAAGCASESAAVSAAPWRLSPGVTSLADLDGDGQPEEVTLDVGGTLTIRDGDTVYQSRDKWRVVEAWTGDTDHDHLPEVVALLDSEAGRHLGLFAWFGGDYRERLVTRSIDPAPLALEVVNPAEATRRFGLSLASGLTGDLVVLIRAAEAGGSGPRRTLLRWNGFSFTSVQ